ncbi:MAG TPA: histidine kinase [Chitinophagaceae bacterium]
MKNQRMLKIPVALSWSGALCLGILASMPGHPPFNGWEWAVDVFIATLFSLFAWYYNGYNLPDFGPSPFFSTRLWKGLLVGVVVMMVLAALRQLLFPQYDFPSMSLLLELRGLLINLVVYIFLHLLHRGYTTQTAIAELERAKTQQLGAQLESLRQQVNPDFLFSNLQTLQSMVVVQDKNAVDFIVKLADFYRLSLEHRKKLLLPAVEEIEMLRAYMHLLKARLGKGISLEIQLSEAHRQSFIPVFTLQLLLENCIKHNLASPEHPLHVSIYSEADNIVVQNNLQLKPSSEYSGRPGLQHINERYLHILRQTIQLARDDHFFRVQLPVIYKNNYS